MRKLFLSISVLTLTGVAYAAWPMASALQIKQAIKVGDVATLERLVHWEPVRASLKASLADLPTMQVAGDETRLPPGDKMPSIWSRVKAVTAPMMLDRLIDTYVTAEGVTKLHQVRRGAFLSIFGMPPAPQTEHSRGWFGRRVTPQSAPADWSPETVGSTDDGNILARFINFYSRLISARFQSLSVAEFEIADKANSGRRIVSQFVLTGLEWKLTSVKIFSAGLATSAR